MSQICILNNHSPPVYTHSFCFYMNLSIEWSFWNIAAIAMSKIYCFCHLMQNQSLPKKVCSNVLFTLHTKMTIRFPLLYAFIFPCPQDIGEINCSESFQLNTKLVQELWAVIFHNDYFWFIIKFYLSTNHERDDFI